MGVALVVLAATTIERRAPVTSDVEDQGVFAPDPDDVTAGATDDAVAEGVPPTRPACGDGIDCLAWETPITGHDQGGPGRHTAVATEDVVIVPDGGALVARRARTGEVRWRVDLPTSTPHQYGQAMTATDDVLVHMDGSEIVRRDLADGRELWRTDATGIAELGRVMPHEDIVVVVGYPPEAGTLNDGPTAGVAAGLDATTGELLWEQAGQGPAVHRDGVVLITDDAVVALGPSGEPLWERELDDGEPATGLFVSGELVQTFGDDGADPLVDVTTGRELGITGVVAAIDATRALVFDHDGGPSSNLVHLVETGEVRWTHDLDSRPCRAVLVDGAPTVEVEGCDGTRIELDAGDGSVVGTTTGEPVASDRGWDQSLGRYRLRSEPSDAPSDASTLELLDADARTVARFPEGTVPVVPMPPDGVFRSEIDGVLLFEHPEWLAAIELP